jgi:ribosome recycling factor
LSDLEFAFARAAEHHVDTLKKLRTGGRFNPDVIGALRVRPDKKDPATFPLHELAAIVPKGGRTISILVHELDHVKMVMSAIQTSPEFNQQPQRVEDNEQELILKVEAEKADDLNKRVKEICHAWRGQVRADRHKRDVIVKKWRADNTILSDDVRKLEKDMQKLQDKKMAEIDAEEKKVLQQLAKDR